jgi:hypothetical protein
MRLKKALRPCADRDPRLRLSLIFPRPWLKRLRQVELSQSWGTLHMSSRSLYHPNDNNSKRILT